MVQQFHSAVQRGFALPTVLIASIVMIIVLTVAVSATATVRDALLTQYYDQLAEVAGEAGVAYAKACLASNNNKPTWTSAHPLTPQTDCTGTPVSGYPQYIMSSGDVRSSFSVPGPPTLTTDANGNALTIPNSGYVQLLRHSTQVVWKTYNQPTAQPAVVPDLCSGTATSDLGWNNAVLTTGSTFNADPAASAISIANTAINGGPVYYRKDFSVTTPGTYTLTTLTAGNGYYYLDGQLVLTDTSAGSQTINVNISTAGCHTLTAEVDNVNIAPTSSWFMLALKTPGGSLSLVHSDTSWRVTAGNTVHYSSLNYFEGSQWAPDKVFGQWNNTSLPWAGGPTGWNTTSGDNSSQYISTVNSLTSGINYPAPQYSYFRNTQGFYLSTATNIQVSTFCDSNCNLYMDGALVDTNAYAGAAPTVDVLKNVAPGWHDFGVQLFNGGASVNPSGFLFAAVTTSNGVLGNVLMRSDAGWDTSTFWETTPHEYYSYDATYTPSPYIVQSTTASLLIVGGGGSGGTSVAGSGGGGGGGAGGLEYVASYPIEAGQSYPVVVGGGGASVAVASTVGNNGGDSFFSTIRAAGGGGGGKSGGGGPGNPGGSGGGAGYNAYANASGIAGIIGEGNKGGDVLANNNGGGGGGAGGAGGNTNSTGGSAGGNGGVGGPGLAYSISGSSATYAKGGEGGTPPSGAASGANGTGNGGSGVYGASTASGAGGSGVAIVSFKTCSIPSVSATGPYSVTTSGSNTVYTFTGNGTFTANSIVSC